MTATPERPRGPAARRTYAHLAAARRMPTDYELVSTGVHYAAGHDLEVRTPAAEWIAERQRSPLACSDWERFRDPRETTYASYARLQAQQEAFVDGILRSIDELGYDAGLGEAWRATLARVFAPSRYLFHGLQMIAAYVGHAAPSGRVTIACAFQAADEMRRIQRVAYRMRQIQEAHPGFGEGSRDAWQSDPLWQPAREAVERLLVTYDWSEAFVALNLVLKPALDELLMTRLIALAFREGDALLAEILFSLNEDCQWQRAWTEALLKLAADDRPENKTVMQAVVDRWHPLAARAAIALAPALSADAGDALASACSAPAAALGLAIPGGDRPSPGSPAPRTGEPAREGAP